ncbi:thiazole synthase [Selenihalanaerobacter shriftii]|uniref:Thiazole synthase n=1 Tax=Selenihalanaerobacter shriftii TaxID=142842 RepID=A0A1T4LC85_9FIRM|nr:thiazole synthase [Selenihalanaerobacter shriftii]SJZ52271.1 thiazole-phosphate synthase [Selenihalanaerobacter shriftii]
MDKLIINGQEVDSRLFIGTGKFPNKNIIPEVIKRSGAQVVTVALRRMDFEAKEENIINYIPDDCILMPNTSGARTAKEAVKIAKIARAAGCGDWVKIEVISDNKYLLPDNYETIKATEMLVKEGFTVLPYMSPDLMVAKELEKVGAAAVMPLGAPIGTNRGLKTKELVRILIEEIEVPTIVDAGIGKPSDAAEAMELGAEAVLVNTAIATAKDLVLIGEAFKQGVEAGRKAYVAGTGQIKKYASASSPLTGFLNTEDDS